MRFNKEDILIGFFIIFGISYPFLIAFLIFFEDVKAKKQEIEELRSFYSFLLGLEECKEEKARELSKIMSKNLYERVGGEKGLLNTCQSYRKAYTSARVEERLIKEGELLVELLKKEKGMTQRLLSLRLYFEGDGEELKIENIEYEKGD